MDEKKRKPFFGSEPFKRLLAILMTTTAIIVAVILFQKHNANAHARSIWREAQQFNMQAMGLRSRGEVQVGYAWADGFRQWLEMDSLAAAARQRGDEEEASRYAAARDRLGQVSPLLAPPYFDPANDEVPNINAFEADLYLVEATALGENYSNRMRASNAWTDKRNAYDNSLVLFSLVLFLFGLSLTVVPRMRWLFIGLGGIMAAIATFFTLSAWLAPVGALPEEAIETYAQGVGLAFQDDLVGALQAFDRSLDLAPGYANAYYERAKTHFDLQNLQRAAADYESARQSGRDDANVRWNLGWTYYQMGRFDDALDMTRLALDLAPDQLALHFNLALAHLASGEIEEAGAGYAASMDLASQQVSQAHAASEEPPETLWWYLSASAIDLDNLLDCLELGDCDRSPPAEALAGADTLSAAANDLRLQLKSLATSLEFTGQPPGAGGEAAITAVEFLQPEYDETGAIAGYQPLDVQSIRLRGAAVFEDQGKAADLDLSRSGSSTSELFVAFDFDHLQDGQLVVIKVYVNDRESVGLRLVDEWSLGPQGKAVLPLTLSGSYGLSPGDYRVEIYVDSNLVQEASFSIPES